MSEDAIVGGPGHAAKCSLAAEVVRISGRLRLRVLGGSMLPALWPGDVVDIRAVPFAELLPGEIAVFHRDSRVWAHRVGAPLEGPFGGLAPRPVEGRLGRCPARRTRLPVPSLRRLLSFHLSPFLQRGLSLLNDFIRKDFISLLGDQDRRGQGLRKLAAKVSLNLL